MKQFLLLTILFSTTIFAQDAAKNWSVPITAAVSESPATITLTWTENAETGTEYRVYKKVKGNLGWGSSVATIAVGDSVFVDNAVTVGTSYEYLVQKIGGGTLYSWGYINAGIRTELIYNRGDLLLMVDSTHADSLISEISQLEEDLYNDGWMVKTLIVGSSLTPIEVKALIETEYNSLNDLQALYLLGHVAVPYSGDLNPDAHTNHKGAWPADCYYAELNGSWTDATVNNNSASDPRNINIPGDGKFDQSKIPSWLELQVCRVDFSDLPAYTENELQLMRNYLSRAHDFKVGAYVPIERALYDQGGFTGMAEGFAQSGIRNFAPFVGHDSISEVDYFTNLTTQSYLWSYGCGAGSYTSAGALDNGTSLTSAELAGTDMQATFTMLFGSYFGDWDKTNNLMRCALANGKTLSVSWAGRPNWHYHTMAQGDNLGAAALLSMDKNSDYLSLNLGGGFVTGEGVHVSQLGDPSLRVYYVEPASNLAVTNNNNEADLTWTSSTDGGIDGYNIYRRTPSTVWTKVNSSIVIGTIYNDATITAGDQIEYMVKAVKLKTNASGSFYNESLGTTDSDIFTVGGEELPELALEVYPVPTINYVTIRSNSSINSVSIIAASGQLVFQNVYNSKLIELDLSAFEAGIYIAVIQTENGTVEKEVIKN